MLIEIADHINNLPKLPSRENMTVQAVEKYIKGISLILDEYHISEKSDPYIRRLHHLATTHREALSSSYRYLKLYMIGLKMMMGASANMEKILLKLMLSQLENSYDAIHGLRTEILEFYEKNNIPNK